MEVGEHDSRDVIRVSWADVVAGRARVVLPSVAKQALCHRAGAPWSDAAPDAELHDLQREVLARPERTKIVHGGSRLGKSVLGGCEALCEVMLPRTRTAIVAARYDHAGHEFKYVYEGLRRLFPNRPQAFKRLIFRNSMNYHDMEASTIWNSEVRGYSTESDEGASLLGQEFSRVVLGEGSHVQTRIYQGRVQRAVDGWLARHGWGGYVTMYTTPKGYEGCSAAEWERVLKETGRRPELLHLGSVPFASSVWLREASVLENPTYSRDIAEAARLRLDRATYEEQYLGRMTFRAGRVLDHFDDERDVVPMPAPEIIRAMRLGVGIDTGAYTGFILGGLDPDGRFWSLAEVYAQQRTISDACAEFVEVVCAVLQPVFGALPFEILRERIDVWKVDPASQHKMELMELLGATVTGPTGTEGGKAFLLPSLEALNDWFDTGRARIVDECAVLVDQIRKYIWQEKKAAAGTSVAVVTEPRKAYDHLIDALRFCWLGLHEAGPPETMTMNPVNLVEEWATMQREMVIRPLRDMMQEAEERGGLWC